MWDDRSNNLGLHPGLMATHDQETFAYFRHTEVTCVLCPREGGMEETYLQVITVITVHQRGSVGGAPLLPSPPVLYCTITSLLT